MRRASLILLLALAACSGPSGPASVHRSGVTVKAHLSGSTLRVTFTPQKGFHLYDTALPVGGADGVGLATKVAVSGGLKATGAATADQAVHDITVEGVNAPVPVYPAGPVTLSLPATGKGTLTVQYAACSDKICLAPVQGLKLRVG